MRRYVKILKSKSVFYSVYGNDAYVVYYFTGYKIINGRLSFPSSCLDKILILLKESNINYKVIDNYNIIDDYNYKINNYNKYLDMGLDKYNINNNKEIIIDKIRKLDYDSIIKISKYI